MIPYIFIVSSRPGLTTIELLGRKITAMIMAKIPATIIIPLVFKISSRYE